MFDWRGQRFLDPEKYDSLVQHILDLVSEILAIEWNYKTLRYIGSQPRDLYSVNPPVTSIIGWGPSRESVRFTTLVRQNLGLESGWEVRIGRMHKLGPSYFLDIIDNVENSEASQRLERDWNE